MSPQIGEQLLRWQGGFDQCLRLRTRILHGLGSVYHQVCDPFLDGAPRQSPDVEAVELAFSQHLRGIDRRGGNGKSAFRIFSRQKSC